MPEFTDTYATFVIGNAGFLLLGNQLWSYDTNSDSWSQTSTYPGTGLSNHVAQVTGEQAYIGLGFNDAFDWWKYDPETNEWTALSPYPGPFPWGVSSFNIDQKIYVVGKQCWEYDANSDLWAQKTSHPDGRRFAIGFSIGMNGYISTGSSLTKDPQHLQKDLWEFSPN